MGDRDEPRTSPVDTAGVRLRFIPGGREPEPRTGGPTGPGVIGQRAIGERAASGRCLPARLSSARLARHWVMHELASAGVFGAENQIVELLTGELVVNAALHGPSDGQVRVRVWLVGGSVRVEVRDDSPAIPVVSHPGPSAASGRGLALVDSLASTWGVEHHGREGKTVWFSVALDPA